MKLKPTRPTAEELRVIKEELWPKGFYLEGIYVVLKDGFSFEKFILESFKRENIKLEREKKGSSIRIKEFWRKLEEDLNDSFKSNGQKFFRGSSRPTLKLLLFLAEEYNFEFEEIINQIDILELNTSKSKNTIFTNLGMRIIFILLRSGSTLKPEEVFQKLMDQQIENQNKVEAHFVKLNKDKFGYIQDRLEYYQSKKYTRIHRRISEKEYFTIMGRKNVIVHTDFRKVKN